jgi:hypothetical protein
LVEASVHWVAQVGGFDTTYFPSRTAVDFRRALPAISNLDNRRPGQGPSAGQVYFERPRPLLPTA